MQLPTIHGFDWDNGNLPKCLRHGVSREDVEQLFTRDVLLAPDPWQGEVRLRAIGTTAGGRRIFLVFTIRLRDGQSLIRPISARFMRAREWQSYAEEADPDVQNG